MNQSLADVQEKCGCTESVHDDVMARWRYRLADLKRWAEQKKTKK